MRKKMLWLVVVSFLMAGCAGEVPMPADNNTKGDSTKETKVKRIILITNGVSPFWDACHAGMLDAQRELKLGDAHLKVVMVVNDGTAAGQIAKLQQFGTQSDIVAIGVSVIDKENIAIAEEMKKLRDKGIVVVAIDNDLNTKKFADSRYAYVGSNNIQGGRELGLCAKIVNPQGGGWVSFVGFTSAQNAIERVNGFGEGSGKAFRKLGNMGDAMEPTRARENVRNAINNRGKELTTLVGIWSYNAPAIVDVVREKNKRKDFTIVTYDAESGAIKEMEAGMIDAMVVQNPYQMGYEGVRLMRALVEKDQTTLNAMYPNFGQPGGDQFTTDLKVIVPNKNSPVWKEKNRFQKSTKVLTLEQFKTWLKKYDLTGS
ncbi:ABC transporter, substrate-binding protein (cluster 2, ribose/xylose/arabinose/galactose) [hydrothermal vent metagenome]|uniref:ABC transporter, substrate-binding protein (Cluster 2, ribose/xylose/arabinose/galactose) n=1 Tax=hydrothermal vent metagenome TaxID=652676 RepID=A0A3B1DKE3_9ZZZZ